MRRRAFVGTDVRAGEKVTPLRIRDVEQIRSAEMMATVRLDPTWVTESDYSIVCGISGRRADIESEVAYEGLDGPMSEPDWVQHARDQQ